MTDSTAHFGATYQPSVRPQRDAAAVLALVLALCSFVVWFIPAIVAIALASSAKRNIRESDGRRSGKALAVAAQILSAVALFIATGICVLVAFN